MKTGNGVPAATDRQEAGHVRDNSQLKDIEDLIAKLEVVTKQLEFPARPTPTPRATAQEGVPAGDGDLALVISRPCRGASGPRPRG